MELIIVVLLGLLVIGFLPKIIIGLFWVGLFLVGYSLFGDSPELMGIMLTVALAGIVLSSLKGFDK